MIGGTLTLTETVELVRLFQHARRNAFVAGALAANPDLDEQQVQEMADEYIRHSEEQR